MTAQPWAIWTAERMLGGRLNDGKKYNTLDYGKVTVEELAEKLPDTPYADDLIWTYNIMKGKS